MSNAHVKYLLVGGGIAASSAAEAIRRLDPAGSAMLVGQEITRPYHRPPLSKTFLRDEVSRESLFTKDVGWFANHHIELRTGHRVAALDLGRQLAALDSGQEIGFEKLLLATGSSPVTLEIPGASMPNVFYVRTLEDTDRLRTSIEQARRQGRLLPTDRGLPRNTTTGRGRATVIGGGLLGAELAASLTRLGLAVDLIVTSAAPWNGIAGEVAGRFIARLLDHHGVSVHLGTAATRLEGDGRVQRVILSRSTAALLNTTAVTSSAIPSPGIAGDSTIETDLVVAAIGVAVNRQILRGTSISAEKAILTDAACRTNVPNVFAAGDCAAVFDQWLGKHRIGQHWTHASLTGRIAGENMAGGNASFDAIAQFDSEIFGTTIRVFGDARRITRRLIRGTPTIDSPNFLEIGVDADDQIVQILAIGGDPDSAKLESLVRNRQRVNGNEESMKDPANPL